jgi:hypothetical protein
VSLTAACEEISSLGDCNFQRTTELFAWLAMLFLVPPLLWRTAFLPEPAIQGQPYSKIPSGNISIFDPLSDRRNGGTLV